MKKEEVSISIEKKHEKNMILLYRLRFIIKIRAVFWDLFLVWLIVNRYASTEFNRITSISLNIVLGLDCIFLFIYFRLMNKIEEDYH